MAIKIRTSSSHNQRVFQHYLFMVKINPRSYTPLKSIKSPFVDGESAADSSFVGLDVHQKIRCHGDFDLLRQGGAQRGRGKGWVETLEGRWQGWSLFKKIRSIDGIDQHKLVHRFVYIYIYIHNWNHQHRNTPMNHTCPKFPLVD